MLQYTVACCIFEFLLNKLYHLFNIYRLTFNLYYCLCERKETVYDEVLWNPDMLLYIVSYCIVPILMHQLYTTWRHNIRSAIFVYFWLPCCHFVKWSDPFSGMIFYLWTDLNDICTAYVKLNSNSILFVIFFLFFYYGFRENLEFSIFFVCVFSSNFQKNKSQKLSKLEEKQRQFWNLHWIPYKVT